MVISVFLLGILFVGHPAAFQEKDHHVNHVQKTSPKTVSNEHENSNLLTL
jgi:hypothetical protein